MLFSKSINSFVTEPEIPRSSNIAKTKLCIPYLFILW